MKCIDASYASAMFRLPCGVVMYIH